jgi:Flp pilus assembly pilin Flp
MVERKRRSEFTSAPTLRREDGVTVVEVAVAALLLAMTAVATLGAIDTSTRTTFRAEETQTVINIAQREMERLREFTYSELAMTGALTATTDANLPTSRIRSGNQFCLARVDGDDPCSPSALTPMVVNNGQLENGGGLVSGGQVAPFSDNVEVGDITVDIYRFVVWQNEGDPTPLPPSDPICQNQPLHFRCKTQDYKRAIVAVRVEEAAISHERPYEEVQSDFIDPDRATTDAPPLGPGGNVVTGQQFYLSDTRCGDDAGDPTRPPGEPHPTHNTLGTCAAGASDAADALLGAPPIDPDPGDESNPAFFDYSTEIEPGGCQGDNCNSIDSGLQMLDQDGPCVAAPSGDNAHRQIHRWVSRPIPSGFTFELRDQATLELWTKTINGVQSASGKVCAFLFKRMGVIDTPVASGTYSNPAWPSGPNWEEVRVKFELDDVTTIQRTLLPGERLGVSIGVDPSGTPDNVLEFLYDHPEGESRLEVLTDTPLP